MVKTSNNDRLNSQKKIAKGDLALGLDGVEGVMGCAVMLLKIFEVLVSRRSKGGRDWCENRVRVDGWMGGWVDGWMGGWVDGWMGGWVDGWMGGWACSELVEGGMGGLDFYVMAAAIALCTSSTMV